MYISLNHHNYFNSLNNQFTLELAAVVTVIPNYFSSVDLHVHDITCLLNYSLYCDYHITTRDETVKSLFWYSHQSV